MRTIAKVFAALTACIVIAIPNIAHAAPLNAQYDATGWSHIASTDSELWIKPTTLSVTVDTTTAEINGHLPLQPADTKFHLLGFLPIKAQVNFEEAAPLTGMLGRGTVSTQSSYYIRLSNVLIGGVPTYVTDDCRTKEPVVINAGTPAGGRFDLDDGGKLVGEYSIGDFEHCFGNQLLINQIIPGDGNTVDIDVTNGRLG
jgi:hypothetical protein